MFSVRTNLILSMVLVGLMFLIIAYIALAVYAIDNLGGNSTSGVGSFMLIFTLCFGFVEYSMYNALPVTEMSKNI